MSETVEKRPLSALVADMLAAQTAARSRPGAPWNMIDGMVRNAFHAASRSSDTGANLNSPADREAKARIRAEVEKAIAECRRWADMPADQVASAAAVATAPKPEPAPTPEVRAGRLLDDLARRGVRIEVGSRNRLSVRPAHLLSDLDRANLTALRAVVAKVWLERNQVAIFE
ncbi:hypothetical protein J2D73_19605 [Acetobacter sacchari]|uniref:Uncharacterized protein n=1 Tax=Acetobacter sacchari TaxID=2661687 RepID=A0ABS3M1I0_9PROT|nr:hypothetical protein [Acetobacter sacchari]MBO1361992.1 hypothetical protein [Acetobacter sacchari]